VETEGPRDVVKDTAEGVDTVGERATMSDGQSHEPDCSERRNKVESSHSAEHTESKTCGG